MTGLVAAVLGARQLLRDRTSIDKEPESAGRAAVGAKGDNPISRPEDDLLQRDRVVASIADELRTVDASEGYVMALTGPWGSGKTSLLNLVKVRLGEDPALPVVDFNPWMFSNTEQLVESFFSEVAAQLRMREDRLIEVAADIEAYGQLLTPLSLIPIAGPMIGRIGGAAGAVRKYQEYRRGSVVSRKKRLAAELAKIDGRIIVVLDDIDRLHTTEIRDIFKLVRLTASFPNIVYLLAFDRDRVEDALTESGVPGRMYLEKVIQTAIDLPSVPDELLITYIGQALDVMLADLPGEERFDEVRWPDILIEIIKPLFNNMRDVRRYAASVRSTVRSLGDQIELVDILALEAIRIFLPDLFAAIVRARAALTTTRSFGSRSEDQSDKEAVQRVVEAAHGYGAVANALISRLFPAGLRHIGGPNYGSEWEKSWLKARRVAHADVLRLYLERTHTSGMAAFTDAEKAFALLADRASLEEFLSSIDIDRLEDVVAALENYEGDYPPHAVPAAALVLLNMMPRLPDRPRGMMDPDARLVVSRVVLRLLRQIEGQEEVANVVRAMLPEVTTFSSRFQLVLLVGHIEGAGHKLVSEQFATEIERHLAEDVRRELPSDVSNEWDYLRVLYWAYRRIGVEPATLELSHDPAVHAQVLLTAQSETRGVSGDSRWIRRESRLSWEVLEELYGGEEVLGRAIESVRRIAEDGTKLGAVVDLAEKYLGGWRPED